jgi:hypothetical protein
MKIVKTTEEISNFFQPAQRGCNGRCGTFCGARLWRFEDSEQEDKHTDHTPTTL